ncbi:MAG: QueT transporter family protein [Clostridia bacterium]|nr:QueT transporter family protein [Clostridia bacterium]
MFKFSAKKLARSGVIAALYVVLTLLLAPISFGTVQARVSEALTILPIFFPEAVPALYVACMLVNLIAGYGVYDIFLGSLATLFAAIATYLLGKFIKNVHLKGWLGIIPPVVFNALMLPVVFLLAGGLENAYFVEAAIIAAGELLVLATVGMILYYAIDGFRKKSISFFL